MSRAMAFIGRLEHYGTDILLKPKPSTAPANKCSCWEHGYPDPDCSICGGDGYIVEGSSQTVKAFIFPQTDSEKEVAEDMGIAKGGACRVYLSPEVDLALYEEVTWEEVVYRITQRDKAAIADEIIYKTAILERIN